MSKKNKYKKNKSNESVIDINLKALNGLKKEYLNSFEKRRKIQEEMASTGYNSLEEKLEALKFKND
jgi:hypothetical protein